MKTVKFYGGILFDDNEIKYATRNPDEPVYVGPPTQEMDDAWYALVHSMVSKYMVLIRVSKQLTNCIHKDDTLAVTPEEAREVSDRSAFDKYRGHYTVG